MQAGQAAARFRQSSYEVTWISEIAKFLKLQPDLYQLHLLSPATSSVGDDAAVAKTFPASLKAPKRHSKKVLTPAQRSMSMLPCQTEWNKQSLVGHVLWVDLIVLGLLSLPLVLVGEPF